MNDQGLSPGLNGAYGGQSPHHHVPSYSDSTQTILGQLNANILELNRQLQEVSLSQQRNSVRLDLLEQRGRNSSDGSNQPTSSKFEPLRLLADCAELSSRGNDRDPSNPSCDDEDHAVAQVADSIKDKVKSVSLPARLLLPTTQGVKVGDRKRAAVIRSSAGFVTTSLKLLKSWESKTVTSADLDDLFCLLYCHMRHLQGDLTECVLEANTPKSTMDYFKYLNSNEQALSPRQSHNFETACSWTVASQKAAEADRRQSGSRGRFRSGQFGRRPFRGGRQRDRMEDLVTSLDNSFPTQKRE